MNGEARDLLDAIDRATRHPSALNPTAADELTPGTASRLKALVLSLATKLADTESELATTRDDYATCWGECEYLRDRLAEREMPPCDADAERIEDAKWHAELAAEQEAEARDLEAEKEMQR